MTFTIKELGDFTRKIKTLQPGQKVYVDGPFAHFSVARHLHAEQFVFVAGGVGITPIDIDATNDALAPILTALSPRTAVDFALSIAEEIDRELEQAPDRLTQDIYGLEGKFKLKRSEHRREHLDEIEARLQEKKVLR